MKTMKKIDSATKTYGDLVDYLASAVGPWATWAELEAVLAKGYVPTLQMSRPEHVALSVVIESRGYRYFPRI